MKKFPTSAGVYLHKNSAGEVIYIGKAKNLRNRLASYFKQTTHDIKTEALIRHIASTEFIVTNSELEALILENSLIKKHKPKYNIQLKEEMRYSYIQITKEDFPRILVSRKTNKKDTFFGPYTTSVANVTKMLRELFQIRSCKVLPKKTCIYYDLKLCTGPCEQKISKEDYLTSIKDAANLIKNGSDELKEKYLLEMKEASKDLNFERALEIKHRLELLKKFEQRQIVEATKQSFDQDVIGIASQKEKSSISILKINYGVINKKIDFKFLSSPDLLNEFLKRYYTEKVPPAEIILSQKFDPNIPKYLETIWNKQVHIIIPTRGIKYDLLKLAKKNAYANFELEDPILIEIKEMLELDEIPITIDFFDISNIGESVVVGGCVQFKNKQPNKSAYRLYNIRGDFGQDDFRSIEEIVKRRYTTMSLPNLIMIDGGLAQVNFALKALQDLRLQTHVRGLAKKEEVIIFPVGRHLKLDRRLAGSKLIIKMRDAVHNFSISHSRSSFKKHYKSSELDEILGIGEATKFKLLSHFGSLAKIKEATFEELQSLVGKSKAYIISNFFKAERES